MGDNVNCFIVISALTLDLGENHLERGELGEARKLVSRLTNQQVD